MRRQLRARYGLEWGTTADATLADAFLTDCLNEAHYWLAAQAETYFNPAVSVTLISGQSAYALGVTVIRADERTFRYTLASTYTALQRREYASLIQQYGPLENVASGTPLYFHLHAGAADAEGRKVSVVPAPSSGGTMKFGAWLYPAALASNSDVPELQTAEHGRIVTVALSYLARFEAARGQNVNVAQYEADALRCAQELRAICRGAIESPVSSATPISPAAGRAERAQR